MYLLMTLFKSITMSAGLTILCGIFLTFTLNVENVLHNIVSPIGCAMIFLLCNTSTTR